MRTTLIQSIALAGALALAACGDKPEQSKRTPTAAATSAAPSQIAVDLGPRYEATLADGINFSRPGYPTFIVEVSGMSSLESFGRWTDANLGPLARFRFKEPLPKSFTLEIEANAFGPNLGKPVKVRVGSEEKTFVVKNTKDPETYRLPFSLANPSDVIEIAAPHPTSPAELGAKDTRKLGVLLGSLKIRQ